MKALGETIECAGCGTTRERTTLDTRPAQRRHIPDHDGWTRWAPSVLDPGGFRRTTGPTLDYCPRCDPHARHRAEEAALIARRHGVAYYRRVARTVTP